MTHSWHFCNSPLCLQTMPDLDRPKRLRLGLMIVLILGFALVEWTAGYLCHSLALRSDAWHMVTDSGAMLLALSASWLTSLTLVNRLPKGTYPDILAAGLNACGLILMSIWIGWEGVQHLLHPPTQILTTPMLITAILGLIVNVVGIVLLHEDSRTNLNVRGAFMHMLADLASSGGVIIGALAIHTFQCLWLDSCISLLIVIFILNSAFSLLQLTWQQWHSRQARLNNSLLLLEIGTSRLTDVVRTQSNRNF